MHFVFLFSLSSGIHLNIWYGRVTELVEDLQQRLEKGEVMYVHCWGGRGRAGTVGACLLIKAYGLDAEEALVRVQRAFDTRQDEGRRPKQAQKALQEYIAGHG
jgi:protein-tyrosine phosphatase